MTDLERKIALSLSFCTYLPGSFDKGFVRQLQKKLNDPMSIKGRAFMITLFHKYRRQIPTYYKLRNELEHTF